MCIMKNTRQNQEKEVQTSIFSSINGVDLKSSTSNSQSLCLGTEAGIYLPNNNTITIGS